MAPAAGDVIYNHLKDTKRDISYYDLILTGDLGIYGKNILMVLWKQALPWDHLAQTLVYLT